MAQILISYDPADHRGLFKQILPNDADLKFLPDISEGDRKRVLRAAEVLVVWNPAKELASEEFELLENVRLIQLVTAGADHLRFEKIPKQALIASNPGAYAAPMAEHILAMTLALAKRLCVNNAKLRKGEFDQKTRNRRLRGAAFGVLGFGGIGKAAAGLMRSLDMKILAINTSGRTTEPVDFIGTLDDLDYLLKNSHVLLVSIPLTLHTKGLIGKRELALMKPDATIINVARGSIIDEKALYDHLVRNPEFSAGIDTWWIEPQTSGDFRVNHPFFDLPNFLGSPHNSAIVPGVMTEAVKMAAKNVAVFLRDGNIHGVIRREDYLEG